MGPGSGLRPGVDHDGLYFFVLVEQGEVLPFVLCLCLHLL